MTTGVARKYKHSADALAMVIGETKMKKLMVAGVASVALAIVPMMTSFATTSEAVKDSLDVTIYDTCAFEKTASAGTTGEVINEYSTSIMPGAYSLGFGGSTFTVTCNTPDVYTVTAVFSDLVQDGVDEAIAYSTLNPDGSRSIWTTTIGEPGEAPRNVTSGDTILSATQADGGSTATVHYSVGAASGQAAGAYSGSAVYTLVSGGN